MDQSQRPITEKKNPKKKEFLDLTQLIDKNHHLTIKKNLEKT